MLLQQLARIPAKHHRVGACPVAKRALGGSLNTNGTGCRISLAGRISCCPIAVLQGPCRTTSADHVPRYHARLWGWGGAGVMLACKLTNIRQSLLLRARSMPVPNPLSSCQRPLKSNPTVGHQKKPSPDQPIHCCVHSNVPHMTCFLSTHHARQASTSRDKNLARCTLVWHTRR